MDPAASFCTANDPSQSRDVRRRSPKTAAGLAPLCATNCLASRFRRSGESRAPARARPSAAASSGCCRTRAHCTYPALCRQVLAPPEQVEYGIRIQWRCRVGMATGKRRRRPPIGESIPPPKGSRRPPAGERRRKMVYSVTEASHDLGLEPAPPSRSRTTCCRSATARSTPPSTSWSSRVGRRSGGKPATAGAPRPTRWRRLDAGTSSRNRRTGNGCRRPSRTSSG